MSEDELPDLMDPEVQRHPYNLYKTLQQRQCPVHKMPSTGFHLVVSDAAARETLRQPDLFLSGVSPMALADGGSVDQEILDIYQNEGWVPLASCSTSDPPRHTKVRGFLESLFKVERIRRATPMIDRVAIDLLDQWQDASEVAFVRDFAHPFPMMVIANLMGVPDGDMTQFKLWSDAIVEPFSMMASRERRLECARLVVEMQHYFAEMIEARRKTPRDDFISEALSYRDEHGDRFDMQELMTLITIDLLASGNETTTAAISSGMRLLLEGAEAMNAVSHDLELIPTLCEEILRLESPAQGMFRECAADAELAGVALKRGELLSVRFGAANRDEERHSHAERIDLHRAKPGSHLAFGMGRHVCVGAALARRELISAFTVLFQRYQHFSPVAHRPEPQYQPSFFGRNLDELYIAALSR